MTSQLNSQHFRQLHQRLWLTLLMFGFVICCSTLMASAACGCSSAAAASQSRRKRSPEIQFDSPVNGNGLENLSSGSVRLIEGDILIAEQPANSSTDSQTDLADAVTASSIYWPNGTLYYSLSAEFTTSEVAFIEASLRELQLAVKNAITFERVAAGSVADYVAVYNGVGCNSYVGRQRIGAQALSLQRSVCLQKYIVQHEFMHALGFWHEQSRSDRDQFVTIWWSYIDSGKCDNFGVFGSPPPSDYPTYDTASIMHYDSFAFTCNGAAATITTKANGRIPYPVYLASSDLQRIHYYYGPGDNTTSYSLSAIGIEAPGAKFILAWASVLTWLITYFCA